MEDCATSIVGLNTNLKGMREEFAPLKKRLIEEMASAGIEEIPCGNYVIKLETKRAKKAVGMKQVLSIVQAKFGVEALAQFKQAVEEAKGDATVKHSLKIVDA